MGHEGLAPTERRKPDTPRSARIGFAIFVALVAVYGYFHQGGGWNQNSRFDQVRAIVENHQLEINENFLYRVERRARRAVSKPYESRR
jgi:hypothetical protein